MSIIKAVALFVNNGFDTLYKSSKGEYKNNSQAISEIREEIFGKETTLRDDKKNLNKDMQQVGLDIRRGYNKIVLENV